MNWGESVWKWIYFISDLLYVRETLVFLWLFIIEKYEIFGDFVVNLFIDFFKFLGRFLVICEWMIIKWVLLLIKENSVKICVNCKTWCISIVCYGLIY